MTEPSAPAVRPLPPLVAVVGGGISGLAAARALLERTVGGVPPRVVVLEASDRFGGKLLTGALGPLEVDLGAESMLARRPEGVDLVRAAGLGEALTSPATTRAHLVRDGRLHPLPGRTLMGVPGDPESLRGLLTDAEVAEVEREPRHVAAPVDGDVAVGDYVAERVGRAVVDRIVEPLLGGVYAGHAAELSLEATVPVLARAAARGGSLLAAVREALPPVAPVGPSSPPVFAGVVGGVGRLPVALVERLREAGAELRTRVTVRDLHRTARGWRLDVGPVPDSTSLDVDAVVLAVPARASGRLLREVCPSAAGPLSAVELASVAVVALAVERDADAGLPGLPGSGVLVPPVEGRPVKAMTFSSAKWAWTAALDPRLAVVRLSIGRHREEALLQRDDADLTALAVADAEDLLRRRLPMVAGRVVRWGGSLPQPAVGHVRRMADVRSALAPLPGLALAGAVTEGVGIPACVASATRAAEKVAGDLEAGLAMAGGRGRMAP